MTQQVLHGVQLQSGCISTKAVCISYSHSPITTVAGDDYEAVVGERLEFAPGETRICHIINILQDESCEFTPNEFFFSDLAYVSGVQPITIDPPTAQVVIDDSRETECSKYDWYHNYIQHRVDPNRHVNRSMSMLWRDQCFNPCDV